MICDDCLLKDTCTASKEEREATLFCMEKVQAEKENDKIVYCKNCIHRDPEDKKCECGALERAGCIFPVADDYYCAYGKAARDE